MNSANTKQNINLALEWYAHMGIDVMARSNLDKAAPIKPSKPSSNEPQDKASMLAALKNKVMSFDLCALKHTATNTVFGDGAIDASIMIIGEAPGATEDAEGIPFCGESGKLLDNMLASIGLSRKTNVYITNTAFWRPPGNRRPSDEEIEQCRPFVEEHIAIIDPKLLILVGSTAVESLLGKHLQISKIRQEHYHYTNKCLTRSITTTALFHPAYLLRQPMQKKTTWYDLLKIKEFLAL
ncbi:MAG: uracil-DNA glycosylase [Pseudomonadota bacterium]